MKRKRILAAMLFAILLVGCLSAPVSAEPKTNRNTEMVMTIHLGETGYAFPVKKVDKQGEKLTGSRFIGYYTDDTFALDEHKRLTDAEGFELTINPDLNTNSFSEESNFAMVVPGGYYMGGAFFKPTHFVLKETATPEGYEKEVGKLYYFSFGEYDTNTGGRIIHILPQSQDDCYFTDDGTLVLENSKEAAATPNAPTEPEKQKPEEKTNNNTGSTENTQKENNNSNGTTAAQTGDILNAKGYILLLSLAGAVFVCNVAAKKRKQL